MPLKIGLFQYFVTDGARLESLMIVFLCSFPWGPGREFMILDLLYLMRQKTSLTKIAFNSDVYCPLEYLCHTRQKIILNY